MLLLVVTRNFNIVRRLEKVLTATDFEINQQNYLETRQNSSDLLVVDWELMRKRNFSHLDPSNAIVYDESEAVMAHSLALERGFADFIDGKWPDTVVCLRIHRVFQQLSTPDVSDCVTFNDAVYDSGQRRLTCQGSALQFTRNAGIMMYALIRARGRILCHDYLLECLKSAGSQAETYNAVSTEVSKINTRLRKHNLPLKIETARALGYFVSKV